MAPNRLKSIAQLLLRRLPYIFLWTLSIYGISWVVPKIYYMVMPGNWWISINQPVTATSARLGQPVTLKFCRATRFDNIQATGYRSFYRIKDNQSTVAGDYPFKATIERKSSCQYLTINPERLPQEAGVYQSHTDLIFYIDGNKKVVSYDLVAPFTLSDTAETLEQRIQELQEQIYDLQQQRGALTPGSTSNGLPVASQTVTAAVPPSLVVRPVFDPGKPTTPPSSVPPTPPSAPAVTAEPVAVVPPEPGKPVDPQPIQGSIISVLQNATGLVRDLVRVVI